MVCRFSNSMLVSALVWLHMLLSSSGQSFLCDEHVLEDTTQALSHQFQEAAGDVLGCVANPAAAKDDQQFVQIRSSISNSWNTMPKDGQGRADWRSVRYLAHRHFNKHHGLVVKGLEPSRPVNGTAAILSQRMPEFAKRLVGHETLAGGYSMEDTVLIIAALERVIYDSELPLLERAYAQVKLKMRRSVSKHQLHRALKAYMKLWILGDGDKDMLEAALEDDSIMSESLPGWDQMTFFLRGRIEAFAFDRARAPRNHRGRDLMSGLFSFTDAQKIVEGVTQSLQSFWASECTEMKQQLVAMDKEETGRVRLVDFYGTGAEEEGWRFAESELYLRRLGALDESSTSLGIQVMIPNYLQAASNCIITREHYLMCCRNECEDILTEVEDEIGASVAKPEALLEALVTRSEDGLVGSELELLLKRVASISPEGRIPLHGRLFAQWLHYAFPLECPYPHKIGAHEGHTLTPSSLGDELVLASEADTQKWQAIGREERKYASRSSQAGAEEHRSDGWMTQWSAEEELFADYARSGRRAGAGKDKAREAAMLSIGVSSLCILVMLVISLFSESRRTLTPSIRPQHGRRHFV